jgi:GNAT superfamily N-acetyltransferase
MAFDPERVDADWLHAWLTGRALARGLPRPFADRGGWRAEIGLASETRRWVFAAPGRELQLLAAEIADPALKLRALATNAEMQAALPPGWEVGAPSFAMVGPLHGVADAPLPSGYRLETQAGGMSAHVFILAANGELAASGHGGAGEQAFIFDRIVTHPAHQRRGLGRAAMAALAATRPDASLAQLLIATEAGRELYQALGWHVVAPYASASWFGQNPVSK